MVTSTRIWTFRKKKKKNVTDKRNYWVDVFFCCCFLFLAIHLVVETVGIFGATTVIAVATGIDVVAVLAMSFRVIDATTLGHVAGHSFGTGIASVERARR